MPLHHQWCHCISGHVIAWGGGGRDGRHTAGHTASCVASGLAELVATCTRPQGARTDTQNSTVQNCKLLPRLFLFCHNTTASLQVAMAGGLHPAEEEVDTRKKMDPNDSSVFNSHVLRKLGKQSARGDKEVRGQAGGGTYPCPGHRHPRAPPQPCPR